MEAWTRLVLRHRWIVLGAWVAVFLVSGAAASGLSDLLTNRFTLPGTDTDRAEKILERHFDERSTGSFTIVVKTPPGRAPTYLGRVRAAADRASKELPTSRVVDVRVVAPDVLRANLTSQLEPADSKGHTDDMRAAIGTIPGAQTFVTGQAAIEHDLDPVFAHDLKVGELYIAIPIALLILVFVFGTLAFLIPFVFAALTISTTLGIIWIFANFMELTIYLQNMVMLIGLGIAIDYSLLVVYRFREEYALLDSKDEAIVRTQATAGRAVVFSGTAVAIGLALLLAMPLPFMRGFGIGGLFIPLVSVVASLTVLPVLLSLVVGRVRGWRKGAHFAALWLIPLVGPPLSLVTMYRHIRGPRGTWWFTLLSVFVLPVAGLLLLVFYLRARRRGYRFLAREYIYSIHRVRLVPRWVTTHREDESHGFWPALARTIMRRPFVVATATVTLLLAFAGPVFTLELGPGSNQGIPRDLEAVRGLDTLTDAVGAGATAPSEIVVDTGRAGGADSPLVAQAVGRLILASEHDPEVAQVDYGDGSHYRDPTGRYLHLGIIGKSEYGTPAAHDFVERFRDDLVPAAGFPRGVEVYAGGGPPSGVDFLDLTYSSFPWLVLAVLVATYVLLLRAFRSVLLPLKAIVLNLLSIGAAYGLLVVVFKWGWGDWVGLIAYDQIEGWIPVMLFAMLFGLSMDYEVFLVSRMREEWDRLGRNERAVASGLAKTGRLVTAAGLIMFAAFMGFVAGSIVGLQQFGFGLAAAIIIDVTIIRALLVPSAMAIFGRWNWWLPASVARFVRVQPSPLARPSRVAQPARGA